MNNKPGMRPSLISEHLSDTQRQGQRATAARQAREWWRALQSSKARTPLMVTAILLVVLVSVVLPLRALVGIHQDYNELKALGESGLHHLLAAKAALAPFTGMSTALQEFQPQANPLPGAPYSLLVQRQSGTAYPIDITIHPSPSLTRQGIGMVRLTPTIAVDTDLSIGTPASPTPKAPLLRQPRTRRLRIRFLISQWYRQRRVNSKPRSATSKPCTHDSMLVQACSE